MIYNIINSLKGTILTIFNDSIKFLGVYEIHKYYVRSRLQLFDVMSKLLLMLCYNVKSSNRNVCRKTLSKLHILTRLWHKTKRQTHNSVWYYYITKDVKMFADSGFQQYYLQNSVTPSKLIFFFFCV